MTSFITDNKIIKPGLPLFPDLETERLFLRQIKIEDASEISVK